MSASTTLPAGFQRSAWAVFDVHARALFLEEILIRNPHLRTVGTVDFESDQEPLLEDPETGEVFSLLGDTVFQPGGSGLVVPIFAGLPPGSNLPLLLIGGAALLFVVLLSK